VKLGAGFDPETRVRAARLAARAWRDLAASLRFFSILPLPAPAEPAGPAFSDFAWAAPLAGALIGLLAALALAIAVRLGLPASLAAVAAVAALVLVCGGLHEDGLADFADGLSAGRSRDERLAIMRDSRIGAFGAIALTLTLVARVAAIAALVGGGGAGHAAAALILVGAAARFGALVPLTALAPARGDGLGASAGRLAPAAFFAAAATTAAVALVVGLANLGFVRALFAAALAAAAAGGISILARRRLGGQTGDVAGAAEQVAEIAALIGLLIGAGPP
jgi:adenosylcobinamide-GDP ribazoletransferase